ncbi:hypothetical protein [Sulfuricaulis sp.]|uniref:hypothetical protein n=1 Tax=Sulfuricaulis sp. TaxID=2003553 RepID=UPI0035597C1C
MKTKKLIPLLLLLCLSAWAQGASGDCTDNCIFTGTTTVTTLSGAGAVGTNTLANSAVTYAKIQNETNNTLLGNMSGGAAAPREIPIMPFNGTPFSPQGVVTNGPAFYTVMNSAADLRQIVNAGFVINSGGTNASPGYAPTMINDTGSAGFYFLISPQSAGFYFEPGDMSLVETAPGTTALPVTFTRLRAVNTLDVTDATAGYGAYSRSYMYGSINNSSIPFGPGATVDKPVQYWLGSVPRTSGGVFTGGPAGAQSFLGFKNGPLTIGLDADNSGTYFGQIDDVTGVLHWTVPIVETSEQVITTTSATVSNNVSTVYLNGSSSPSITVTFPATPIAGQELTLTLGTAYTEITLDGNGKTLVAGTIGVTVGSFGRWKYRAADTTWYRVG